MLSKRFIIRNCWCKQNTNFVILHSSVMKFCFFGPYCHRLLALFAQGPPCLTTSSNVSSSLRIQFSLIFLLSCITRQKQKNFHLTSRLANPPGAHNETFRLSPNELRGTGRRPSGTALWYLLDTESSLVHFDNARRRECPNPGTVQLQASDAKTLLQPSSRESKMTRSM